MKSKILNVMDEYLQSNPLFCRGGVKMVIFTWDSEPNYKGVKMTSERWQHHNVTFTQRSVGLLVKSVHFSNLCCIMCQWWPLQIGERALFKFFSKVCRPVTQKVKRISECLFRYWVLTNFNFDIFIFKAIYGSVPEIIEFQYGSRSKLVIVHIFSGQKPNFLGEKNSN